MSNKIDQKEQKKEERKKATFTIEPVQNIEDNSTLIPLCWDPPGVEVVMIIMS